MKIPERRCVTLGCTNTVVRGKSLCSEHLGPRRPLVKPREDYESWYGRAIWKRIRSAHLSAYPLCEHCNSYGLLTPADSVDHIEAHKGNWDLFVDTTNLQSLCRSCHTVKTNKEDKR